MPNNAAVVERQEVDISDHAVLRYMQRVVGFDMDTIRAEMIPAITHKAIESLGDGKYPIELNGMKYCAIVCGGTIVTITTYD